MIQGTKEESDMLLKRIQAYTVIRIAKKKNFIKIKKLSRFNTLRSAEVQMPKNLYIC